MPRKSRRDGWRFSRQLTGRFGALYLNALEPSGGPGTAPGLISELRVLPKTAQMTGVRIFRRLNFRAHSFRDLAMVSFHGCRGDCASSPEAGTRVRPACAALMTKLPAHQ